jgi:hypothetical protein
MLVARGRAILETNHTLERFSMIDYVAMHADCGYFGAYFLQS